MKDAASYKGMKYEAFRFYCSTKRGPARFKIGNQWAYTKAALDAWDRDAVRKKPGRHRNG